MPYSGNNIVGLPAVGGYWKLKNITGGRLHSPPHQTIPKVHLPAGGGLRRGDGGGEVVEEEAAVLRALGGPCGRFQAS